MTGPRTRTASRAYSLQDGVNRHRGPSQGLISRWYPVIAPASSREMTPARCPAGAASWVGAATASGCLPACGIVSVVPARVMTAADERGVLLAL